MHARPEPVLAGQGRVLLAVAAGGALGALARWAAGLAHPAPRTGVPWTTLGVNVLGCLLMGVLVALVTEVSAAPPLVRPFLGTGVLGGFTTFSGYAVDGHGLLTAGRPAAAVAYLTGTVVAALLATWSGLALVRWAARR
jgi:CrcB protein